ncbi:GIY-YIG nuclease family protein [Candidatus Roizmanbacteria bacterium]|nr:GIY-YIG nuclease family protein [Candidatus Roizmanbacteria bacterium]
MPWAIYILLCDQKTYYVGLSSNVDKRFISHKLKQNLATKEFSDIRLVYTENYPTRQEAERRERQLKGWSVAKKKALINGDKDLLIRLSKTRSMLKNDK